MTKKKTPEEKSATKAVKASKSKKPIKDAPATSNQSSSIEMPDMSTSFQKNLSNIKEGKKILLDSEPGFYFLFSEDRLNKYSDNGSYIDSAPLYTFQDKSGWRVSE